MTTANANRFPKPLEGMLILDLSLLFPGPYCTNQLSAFGARILKIEPPGGDPLRTFSPRMFEELNRNTESIMINFGFERGRALFRRLAEQADAVVDGFRPGVMDRLGLGYETLEAANRKLVYCAISGFGRDGPYRDRPGHDLSFLALGGYYSVPSQIDDRKTRPNIRLADVMGGQIAALATSMALWQAKTTGRGTLVDVSMFDAVASLAVPMIVSAPGLKENDVEQMPHVMADSDLYETRDGRYLALATLEDKFWKNFMLSVESLCPALKDERFDTRQGRNFHKRELSRVLRALFEQKDLAEWKTDLDSADTVWSPVYVGDELLGDPHFKARGFVRGMGKNISEMGEVGYALFPVKFDGDQEVVRHSAPAIGEHTESVLRTLGLGTQEIEELRHEGVIRRHRGNDIH